MKENVGTKTVDLLTMSTTNFTFLF